LVRSGSDGQVKLVRWLNLVSSGCAVGWLVAVSVSAAVRVVGWVNVGDLRLLARWRWLALFGVAVTVAVGWVVAVGCLTFAWLGYAGWLIGWLVDCDVWLFPGSTDGMAVVADGGWFMAL